MRGLLQAAPAIHPCLASLRVLRHTSTTHLMAGSPWCMSRWLASSSKPHWHTMRPAPESLHRCTMSLKYVCSCTRSSSYFSTLLMSSCARAGVCVCVCACVCLRVCVFAATPDPQVQQRGELPGVTAAVPGAAAEAAAGEAARTLCLVLGLGGSNGQVSLVLGLGLRRLKRAGENGNLHVLQLLGHLRRG